MPTLTGRFANAAARFAPGPNRRFTRWAILTEAYADFASYRELTRPVAAGRRPRAHVATAARSTAKREMT